MPVGDTSAAHRRLPHCTKPSQSPAENGWVAPPRRRGVCVATVARNATTRRHLGGFHLCGTSVVVPAEIAQPLPDIVAAMDDGKALSDESVALMLWMQEATGVFDDRR